MVHSWLSLVRGYVGRILSDFDQALGDTLYEVISRNNVLTSKTILFLPKTLGDLLALAYGPPVGGRAIDAWGAAWFRGAANRLANPVLDGPSSNHEAPFGRDAFEP
jgi:hypothetical protein